MSWTDDALALIVSRTPVALVTLTDVRGSAPRDAGVRMVVWANGQSGTIGGGNLEFMVTREARDFLQHGPPAPPPASAAQAGGAPAVRASIARDYPLGPILGQCCGGRVTVRIDRLDVADTSWLKREARVEEGAKTPLLLFGAGHVGVAIARAVAPLPFQLAWFDTRREYATEAKLIADPRAIAAAAPERAFYLIITHNHDLDYEITRAALVRRDAAYCGLIGSASKRARFVRQLRADGVAERDIDLLSCPIGGAFDIKDKSPAIIAAATVAEMLVVREAVALSLAEDAHAE